MNSAQKPPSNRRWKYWLTGVGIIIVLIILALRAWFYTELPPYEGTLSLPGLSASVEVYTDEYGVPHVYADNVSDLMLATGYLQARERLFQLSLVASAARGELALFFGDDLLEDDIYLRTWGIPKVAREMVDAMDPDILEAVQRYCDGINTRIDEIVPRWPLEFKLLGVGPVYWEPSDVTGLARLMAHDLQQSWKPELLFGMVLDYFGPDMLRDLIPEDLDQPTIAAAPDYLRNGNQLTGVWSQIRSREFFLRQLTGTWGKALGSNNWVIAGERTASGKPLLANDPHLGFTQPAKWYEMHLVGGDLNISGVCLPGLPLPVIGQNETAAWGFTNVMADDIDFFIETTNGDHPDQYQVNGEWKSMTIRRETIPLQGGRDTTITIRSTHHGPVISDLHPLLTDDERVVTFQWTGHTSSREVEALFALGRMASWEDFTEVAHLFAVPGQNIVYADTAGNIGWRPVVKIPLRQDGASLIPRPGNDPAYDWSGYIPLEEMPYQLNPDNGIIITANNKTVDDDYPYYISNLWVNPGRARRIAELLRDRTDLTPQEMMAVQTDVTSIFARSLVPIILNVLPDSLAGQEQAARKILEAWDFRETPESAGALVFHATLKQLFHHIYEDELLLIHPDAFDAYMDLPMIPLRRLEQSLKAGHSAWMDNVNTPKYVETIEEIVWQSFQDGIQDIENRVGYQPK